MKLIEKLLAIAALSLAALSSAPALAAPILTFAPSSQTVDLGDIATVDVMVTNLTGEFVGTYDFNVNWDASLLSLQSLTFGDALDGPLDSIAGFLGGSGSVNAFEVSLGALANQDGLSDFRLFTLAFNTLALGTSALSFTSGIIPSGLLGDELGQLLAVSTTEGSITIQGQPDMAVPEPGTLGLMALGVGFIGMLRRRRASV